MAENVRYIESTSKKFYTSKPADHGPDGPQEIKLRGKHRTGGMSPNWNRHSDNNNRARTPGPKRGLHNIPPKVAYMPDAHNGHVRFVTQDWISSNLGITIGFN